MDECECRQHTTFSPCVARLLASNLPPAAGGSKVQPHVEVESLRVAGRWHYAAPREGLAWRLRRTTWQ
jgi:hypothetical protein